MKFLKVFLLVVATLMALLAVPLSAALAEEELFLNHDTEQVSNRHEAFDTKNQEKISLRGTSSVFFGSRAVTTSSCDKNPRVCRAAANSPRSHCCHNKCVDVKTDRLNCGKCGVKCKLAEICCNDHVVHTMSDKKHCGSCNNHCNKGATSAYGMCCYA